ncbi:MAG: FAD-dependent oxidoreductase [Bacteroidota bacterium]|nr:FAD-dependent oxidoreductase [Bacteroidota bacterium]
MKSIIIIGAGSSGLMAASILLEKNYDVTVVEARDRIGGRIHTANLGFSKSLEEGAEFIHGKQPLTLKLLKESNNNKTKLAGNYYQLWNGVVEKGDFFGEDWKHLTKALEEVKEDTDIADLLNRKFPGEKHAELRKKVKGFVEGYDAADMNRVSALALRKEWSQSDNDHQYRIEGGYSSLMNFLAEKIRKKGGVIVMSSPVRELQWNKGSVKALTADGKVLEAHKAIITVPLGVLQRGTITLTPEVPELKSAILALGFGNVIKFFFEFQNDFWKDVVAQKFKKFAFVFSDAEVPTWWSQLPDKTPLLTGWLGGRGTATTESQPEALLRKAVDSLQYILKCSRADIVNNIVKRHVTNWGNDPYALGAYSYPTVQTAQVLSILSKPFKETLYFAGEHIYNGPAMGTVEAALVSGSGVAKMM